VGPRHGHDEGGIERCVNRRALVLDQHRMARAVLEQDTARGVGRLRAVLVPDRQRPRSNHDEDGTGVGVPAGRCRHHSERDLRGDDIDGPTRLPVEGGSRNQWQLFIIEGVIVSERLKKIRTPLVARISPAENAALTVCRVYIIGRRLIEPCAGTELLNHRSEDAGGETQFPQEQEK